MTAPRVRADLTIVRRQHRGRTHYVVKQPRERKYYQFGELQVALLRLMDGRRTPEEIAELAPRGTQVTAGQVADFVHKLKRMGLVDRTPAEQHLMLIEHLRSERRLRARPSILRLRVSIGDPDRLFTRVVRRLGWLWSPAFVAASLALFGSYAAIIAVRWDDFVGRAIGFYTLRGGVGDWILSYGLFVVIAAIHELGHGLTTKQFGGEVHEIGAMLFYFAPALFCDTSDAWTFERRAHRLWVSFAGPWIQLVIASLAAIVWGLSEPETALHRVAFLAVLAGGISSVLANLNPLVPLDGYYAFADWLEIPNLRRRAFAWWSWLLKRHLLAIDAAAPAATPRERRIFTLYGALAALYTTMTIVVGLLWLVLVLRRVVGPLVWVPVALVPARLAWRMRGRGQVLAQVAFATRRAALGAVRGSTVFVAAAALTLALPFVLPWTPRARGEFRVEAAPRGQLRPEVGGVLDAIYVDDGATVRAGALLAKLWSPGLEAQFLETRKRVEVLRLAQARAEAGGDRATEAAAGAELEDVGRRLAVLERERERLVVRAPLEGVVLAYRLRERLGERLAPGAPLLEVASGEGRVARVRLPLRKSGGIVPGQRVSLKMSARPDLTFVSQVAAVAPATREGWLEVEVPVPAGPWQPSPGMVGIAKIVTGSGTVAGAVARAFRENVRLDWWL